MTRDPGQDLVNASRRGDDEAFEALFQRFRERLTDRIQDRLPQTLRRRVSVADVLQEVHLAAYEGRDRLTAEDERALRNWLLSIADHKALQHVRHHAEAARRTVRREVTRPGRPSTAAHPRRQATPSQMAVAAETLELARRVRAKLPPAQAEVLRLAREEGVSLREIAERTGRSYEATKKMYGRALCLFKALFDAERGSSHD